MGGWLEAFLFGLAAAVALQIARLAAGFPDEEPTWLARNLGLFVLPFLAGVLRAPAGARRARLGC